MFKICQSHNRWHLLLFGKLLKICLRFFQFVRLLRAPAETSTFSHCISHEMKFKLRCQSLRKKLRFTISKQYVSATNKSKTSEMEYVKLKNISKLKNSFFEFSMKAFLLSFNSDFNVCFQDTLFQVFKHL
jgi:hypothetical protein